MGNPGESPDEPVPQGGYLRGVLVHVGAGLLQGYCHAHNGRDVLCPSTPAPLLGAALNEAGQRYPLPGVQHPTPLGTVELVGGEGQQVDVLGSHVNGQMARRLHRVGVEGDAPLPAHRTDLGDGQDGTNLVVGVHNGHQGGVLPDSLRHLLGGDGSQLSHGKKLHLKTLIL